MIKAEIIEDSENEMHDRLTTMVLTFPRYILAELNTHRMFSRNSASSRAIPFKKMLKSVWKNPFVPIAWQKDHKGMQGTEYFSNKAVLLLLRILWLTARTVAVCCAWMLSKVGLTKQLANRLLEPFMWHTVIVTASEWENFFHLRCPQYLFEPEEKLFRSWKDLVKYHNKMFDDTNKGEHDTLFKLKQNKGQADIHMMALAEAMWDAMNESAPMKLKAGEWHMPFGSDIHIGKIKDIVGNSANEASRVSLYTNAKVKIATARCARVSYTVVGSKNKKEDYEADIRLHDRLAEMGHWSPFEHCGRAMTEEEYYQDDRGIGLSSKYAGRSGNLKGFIQYRKLFSNENRI